MHELSIAQAVVQIVSDHAAGRRVEKVELRVGHLRQVVPAALEFAFELLASGSLLDGAELVIEDVPARGCCRECGTETVMSAFPLQCSDCRGFDLELLAGEELLVEAIELAGDEEMTIEGAAYGC
ncbi:MAG: hydrogenase maturation nickel metallochaperone HypA [Solirubrobacterales bacterium]|nr:hydrogenase maturation nickel metallochaperone HypA [Solirubrobacterales bacterium]